MKNLISNTAFGKLLLTKHLSDKQVRDLRDNYDEFLSLLLEMWMFFPCKLVDGIWTIMNDPDLPRGMCRDCADEFGRCPNGDKHLCDPDEARKEYQQAKQRCLFEGYDGTIEHLQNLLKLKITVENMVKYYLDLTPTAVKQIGL